MPSSATSPASSPRGQASQPQRRGCPGLTVRACAAAALANDAKQDRRFPQHAATQLKDHQRSGLVVVDGMVDRPAYMTEALNGPLRRRDVFVLGPPVGRSPGPAARGGHVGSGEVLGRALAEYGRIAKNTHLLAIMDTARHRRDHRHLAGSACTPTRGRHHAARRRATNAPPPGSTIPRSVAGGASAEQQWRCAARRMW